MAVWKTTSPVRSTGAPKLCPSKTVPSSRARRAGFKWAMPPDGGSNFYYFTTPRFGIAPRSNPAPVAQAAGLVIVLRLYRPEQPVILHLARTRNPRGAVQLRGVAGLPAVAER